MSFLVEYLSIAGWPLLIGATAILLVGWLGTILLSAPISRQRFGEIMVLASLLWLLSPLFPNSRTQAPAPSKQPIVSERPESTQPSMLQRHEPDMGLGSTKEITGHLSSVDSFSDRSLSAITGAASPSSPMQPKQTPTDNDSAKSFSIATPYKSNNAVIPNHVSPMQMVWSVISDWLITAYVFGVLASVTWLVLGHVLLLRLVLRARPAPHWLQQMVDLHSSKKPPARVLSSPRCHRVMTFGLARPTIMIPASLAKQKHASQLSHVMLHELGHVRQRDARGQYLLNMAFLFFYFHPCYWLLRRQVCFARELVVDDWASRRSCKSNYVSDMIALAKSQVNVPRGLSPAVGAISYPHSQFYRRIKMLIQRKNQLRTRRTTAITLFHFSIMFTVVFAVNAWINVPSALAQDDLTKEYKALVDQLNSDRASLQQQVSDYRDRVATLEKALTELEARLTRAMNERATNAAQTQLTSDQLADRLVESQQRLAAQEAIINDMRSLMNQNAQQLDLAKANEAAMHERIATFNKQMIAQHSSEQQNAAKQKQHATQGAAQSVAANPASNPLATQGLGNGNSRVHSDLIQLATSYADALTERDVSAAEIKHMEELVVKKAASKYQLDIAKIRHDSTRRKAQMLRHVAESTLKSLMAELEQAQSSYMQSKKLFEKGFITKESMASDRAGIMQVESNIELLQRVLDNN